MLADKWDEDEFELISTNFKPIKKSDDLQRDPDVPPITIKND